MLRKKYVDNKNDLEKKLAEETLTLPHKVGIVCMAAIYFAN